MWIIMSIMPLMSANTKGDSVDPDLLFFNSFSWVTVVSTLAEF